MTKESRPAKRVVVHNDECQGLFTMESGPDNRVGVHRGTLNIKDRSQIRVGLYCVGCSPKEP